MIAKPYRDLGRSVGGPGEPLSASTIPANSYDFFVDYKEVLRCKTGWRLKGRGTTVRRADFPLLEVPPEEMRRKELRIPHSSIHYHC